MNTEKVKPSIIEINRFFRPLVDGKIAGNRGITVMFTLDYLENRFTARYAVCLDDTFSKAIGIAYAQACPAPITGNLNKEKPLYTNLVNQVTSVLNASEELQDKKVRRDIKRLHQELLSCI